MAGIARRIYFLSVDFRRFSADIKLEVLKKMISAKLSSEVPKKKLKIPPMFAASIFFFNLINSWQSFKFKTTYTEKIEIGKPFLCDTVIFLVAWRIYWNRQPNYSLLTWNFASFFTHTKYYNFNWLPHVIRFHRVFVFNANAFGQTFAINANFLFREKRRNYSWFVIG